MKMVGIKMLELLLNRKWNVKWFIRLYIFSSSYTTSKKEENTDDFKHALYLLVTDSIKTIRNNLEINV